MLFKSLFIKLFLVTLFSDHFLPEPSLIGGTWGSECLPQLVPGEAGFEARIPGSMSCAISKVH